MLDEQEFRRHEAQHRISQEFQPLVAVQPGGAVLVGVGSVAQRLGQQGRVPEGVIQFFLQFLHSVPLQKETPRGRRGMFLYFSFPAI